MPPNASPKTHTTSPQPALARPAEPRPPAPGGDDEPEAEPHLDPDGGRGGLDRMVGPDGDAAVHEVLDPPGRGGGRRLDHAGGKAQRHGRLELQEPVEDPQAAESETEDAPGGRFGRCETRSRRGTSARPCSFSLRYWTVRTTLKPMAQRAHDQEDDQELVEQSRMEGRDDEGVARLHRATHAGHALALSHGRPGGPGILH